MMLAFSGVIFRVSIDSHRMAGANAQIMQKFRAITDQLNTDFKGLRKDAPLLMWFELDPNTGRRYDQIMFFADGDFQSTRLYDYGKSPIAPSELPISGPEHPVRGNVARIYYGQADLIDYAIYDYTIDPIERYWEFQTLARRCHILTVHPDLTIDPDLVLFPRIDTLVNFQNTFRPFVNDAIGNNVDEHDSVTLAYWKLITANPKFNDRIITTCFDNGIGRPKVDTADSRTLHMLLSEGVGSLKIQWAYWYEGPKDTPLGSITAREWRWWPSVDPDQDGFYNDDSDFLMMQNTYSLSLPWFGVSFKTAGVSDPTALAWFSPGDAQNVYIGYFPTGFFPKALKFTFTLYDSKGVIEDGRIFTHIVYLDD